MGAGGRVLLAADRLEEVQRLVEDLTRAGAGEVGQRPGYTGNPFRPR
jgi:hypothetical protein